MCTGTLFTPAMKILTLQWINSKQYVESLKEHNLHKLLACMIILSHLEWSGHYSYSNKQAASQIRISQLLHQRAGTAWKCMYIRLTGGKVAATMHLVVFYGDVYIPSITTTFKDHCGLYDTDIASKTWRVRQASCLTFPVDMYTSTKGICSRIKINQKHKKIKYIAKIQKYI